MSHLNGARLLTDDPLDSVSEADRDAATTTLREAGGYRVSQAARERRASLKHWSEIVIATQECGEANRPTMPFRWANGGKGSVRKALLAALKAAKPIVDSEPDDPEAETSLQRLVYATLADAIDSIGTMEYLWDGWIPKGAVSTLAANAGIGKTRVALGICRVLYHGLPTMPDGSPNRYPPGTRSLWIMADRNFQETAEAALSIGLPLEAIILNTSKANPVDLPDFDDSTTIDALRAQIEEMQPGLVIIDTITYATSRNTNRAEEAKVAFEPILKLAVETGVAILALAHLNAEGGVLGRRLVERVRSVISLTQPDPEGQPNRRKLWVSKSAMKRPEPLGITFRDLEIIFDSDPPEAPEAEPKRRGPKPSEKAKLTEWLWNRLQAGPQPVCAILDAAADEANCHSTGPLYRAKDYLPTVHPGFHINEYKASTPRTSKLLVHWAIAPAAGTASMDADLSSNPEAL